MLGLGTGLASFSATFQYGGKQWEMSSGRHAKGGNFLHPRHQRKDEAPSEVSRRRALETDGFTSHADDDDALFSLVKTSARLTYRRLLSVDFTEKETDYINHDNSSVLSVISSAMLDCGHCPCTLSWLHSTASVRFFAIATNRFLDVSLTNQLADETRYFADNTFRRPVISLTTRFADKALRWQRVFQCV